MALSLMPSARSWAEETTSHCRDERSSRSDLRSLRFFVAIATIRRSDRRTAPLGARGLRLGRGGGQFARAAAEAGADQGLLVAGADHRLAVELLDREFLQLAGGDRVGEGAHRRFQLATLDR